MPESSFFDPIEMGGFPAPAKPKLPTYAADPRVTAGYRNVFGTQFGVNASPVTQRAGANVQFPIGDHQRQLFLQGDAYVQPGTGQGSPSDYGFRLGISKKIPPQGMSGGEAINQALQQNLGQNNVINASTRSELFNTLTPEQLRILGQDAKQIQRQAIDARLGIREGVEKYGFGLGVDVPNIPRNEDGSLQNPAAITFAKQYAGDLTQGNFGATRGGFFADPNTKRGVGTPGINPEAEPQIDPYTGEYTMKRSRILN